MRIVFFVTSFFPRALGPGYSSLRLAKALRHRGVEVRFLVDEASGGWSQGGTYEGFSVRSFPFHDEGKKGKFIGLYRFTRELFKLRHSVDIFHVHGGDYITLFLAFWMKLIVGCKTMLKITSNGYDTPDGVKTARHGRKGWLFYKNLDGVVCLASGQRDQCRDHGYRGAVAVIPNAVDTTKFRPVTPKEKLEIRKEKNIPPKGVVIMYAGWLGYQKGSDILFKVWKNLSEWRPDCFLLCVGDYLKDEKGANCVLKELETVGIERDWLNDSGVRWLGRVEDIHHYFQAADIFVFPSRNEGFGTVQVEAMACGLPCVVNDIPGVSCDIFPDNTTGYRLKNATSDDYARFCKDLIQDEALRTRIGKAARQRVEAAFSTVQVAQKYEDFYQTLLGCKESGLEQQTTAKSS